MAEDRAASGTGAAYRRGRALAETPHPNPSPEGEGLSARVALAEAAARFAFSATARLDAELLLAHALGISRERLLLTLGDFVAPPGFAALVARRAAHEPIAYINGTRAFWTIDLDVAPGVLIPRADSETLIEAAVDHFAGSAGPRTILDLGTGSGALLLAALDQWPVASGVGIDASPQALAIARANAARIAPGRATIVEGGWQGTGGAFDLVLCNPPYVPTGDAIPDEVARYEPASALYAGADGLDDYRRLAPLIRAQIAPGGVACFEIGATQLAGAGALFEAAGCRVSSRRDLAGHDRCLIITA